MAKAMIKLKPKKYAAGDIVDVNMIAIHPMETGMRKDKKSGEVVPLHYIDSIKLYFNDKLITNVMSWETLSRDPFVQVSFKVPGKGELKMVMKDNKGEVTEKTTKVKPKG